jgi:hypothetical protein
MQVSQVAELDTHAVIGGGQAEAFAMSDSAEFFTVLSDTLYRDKKRAVVREVICNAWDAHIELELDRPIEITLTEEELIVKDFGPGIPHEHLHGTYCVFGYSTKLKKKKATGGFGLGSKAPFAYSDHFSVVNCHAGLRSVNAISRGGLETEGKPERREMVRVPTTDSGVIVTIPIRTPADRIEFETSIRSVVRQGGIKAKLNGELLPSLDYTNARKLGYCMARVENRELFEASAYALLGTVLYPISTTDRELSNKVRLVGGFSPSNYRLILVCPPDSLGITPSREALSYTPRTIETIKGLLDRAEKNFRTDARKFGRKLVEELSAKTTRYDYDLHPSPSIHKTLSDQIVTDRDELARVATSLQFRTLFTENERERMAAAVLQRKFKDDRRYFRRLVHQPTRGWNGSKKNHYRHSARLVLRAAGKLGLLHDLYVHDNGYDTRRRLIPIAEHADDFSPFNEHLVLAPTNTAALKHISKLRDSGSIGHRSSNTLVFVIRRNTDATRDAIKAEARRLKIEIEECDFPLPKKRVKAATDGPRAHFFDLAKVSGKYSYKVSEVPALVKADYYLQVDGSGSSLELKGDLINYRDKILNHYPNIAIAWTTRQLEKVKASGAKDLIEVVFEEFKTFTKKPDVLFSTLRKSRDLIEHAGYYDPANVANYLAYYDESLARLLFPEAPRLKTNLAHFELIYEILQSLPTWRHRLRPEINNAMSELQKAAREKFKFLQIDRKQANERFAYLDVLVGVHSFKAPPERLCLLVRTLQRSHAKSLKNTQSVKEAA